MKLFKKLFFLFLLILVFFIREVNAYESSLTINYSYDYKNLEGIYVETYLIANYDNGIYQLTDYFKDYSIDLSNISSQDEWRELATTLSSYIIADNLKTEYKGMTNEKGEVTYSHLNTGLYLTLTDEVQINNKVIDFKPFLTVIPSSNEIYIVKPKPTSYELNYEEKEYTIVKQWKDKNHINERVKNVLIDIYKDTTLYQSINLNSDNNWSYKWKYKDDGSKWCIVERNIDKNYKVSIYENNEDFIVTNSYIDTNDKKNPTTGDTTNIMFYIIITSTSGILFILLALFLRKRDHD